MKATITRIYTMNSGYYFKVKLPFKTYIHSIESYVYETKSGCKKGIARFMKNLNITNYIVEDKSH